jgi:starch synthase
MQVLSVTPRVFPLIETAGAVTGALPIALAARGVIVRTLIPGFPTVMAAFKEKKAVLQYPLRGRQASSFRPDRRARTEDHARRAHLPTDGGPYGNATGVG